MKRLIGLLAVVVLAGCDSFSAAPYSISADNDVALKSALGSERVSVGDFTLAKQFDANCRMAGPIQLPGGMSYQEYVQKAFADELKVSGNYDAKAPIILTGVITDMQFGSTSGTWDIALTLKSTNGKSMSEVEHYEFHTSFTAESACKNVADAFQPAVQGLVGKVVSAAEFGTLLR
jgi:hypothetical protein